MGPVLRRDESAEVGRLGVTYTQLAVQKELRWMFREQATDDYGIDAHVEVVVGNEPRGRLLALQIKCGTSYFDRPSPDGWWFWPERKYARYWHNHSLPVVVVLVDPRTGRCYWQLFCSQNLKKTATSSKLSVPRSNVLDSRARDALQRAAEGDPHVLRTRQELMRPSTGRLPLNRRTIVLGGLAALMLAADSTTPISPRTSRTRSTTATKPTVITKARVVITPSKVDALVFNPRGGTLASSGEDGSIRLWNTEDWINTSTLPANAPGCAIAFSPDGSTLASGDNNQSAVTLWSTATKRATSLPDQSGRVFSVAFSPDGRSLASGSPMDTIAVWDVAHARRTAGFNAGYSVNSVAFNRDGDALALGCDDGTVHLLDLPAGSNITSFPPGHTGSVEWVAFSPDWTTLASCGADHTVRLWNVALGSATAVLRGHTDWVEAVAFSPDGKTLASASRDATIRLWDLTSHKTTAILLGHTSWVNSVAFSPDGRILASASLDTTIRLWALPH